MPQRPLHKGRITAARWLDDTRFASIKQPRSVSATSENVGVASKASTPLPRRPSRTRAVLLIVEVVERIRIPVSGDHHRAVGERMSTRRGKNYVEDHIDTFDR
ncbi:MAG: hypothetical protein WCA28_04240 [Bradyrhizobium sp.]